MAGPKKMKLDDNGNGFAIAIGDSSCSPGSSLIEADLEEKPFTTLTTTFTVLPPQPTEEPAFAIEKKQEIAGSGGGFTTSPLTASIGQTVDYEIVVTNTANVDETFSEVTDANCDAGTIAGGPGVDLVEPGASTTYTCHHLLSTVGRYVNEATVTGASAGGRPLRQTSNEVEVTAYQPAFTIEKLQQIAGSASGFTTAKLTGTVGQTVDYEIVVTNTGDEPLTFSSLSDPRCDPGTIAGGPGSASVLPGESTTYTCSHVLASVGTYTNVGTVAGTPSGEGPITHSSPPVEVEVRPAPAPSFTIRKLQEIAGTSTGFTTETLTGAVGQTVDYEIVVENTGNVPLALSTFTDPRCDTGTIAGGPGASPLEPGASTTFTCSHVLSASGAYVNVATVTATPPGEPPLTVVSHEVEVKASTTPKPEGKGGVLPSEECHVPTPALQGATGPERGTFTVHVSSNGVKQITFYLDGRKVKTLGQSQSKGKPFSLKINAAKLSYGAHRVSFKTVMVSAACAETSAGRVFVRPYQARVKLHFTG